MDGKDAAPTLRLGRWWRPPSMPEALARVAVRWADLARCPETGGFVTAANGERARASGGAAWSLERRVGGEWKVTSRHRANGQSAADAVLRAQRSLVIRSVPSWTQVHRAMVRALVAEPVAMASSLLGRREEARRSALRFLETIGLIGHAQLTGKGEEARLPPPVRAFVALNPKARLVYWLNPDHALEARALVDAWDIDEARREADEWARRERRLVRLRTQMVASFPGMPEEARGGLDEDRLASLRPGDAVALEEFLLAERFDVLLAGAAEGQVRHGGWEKHGLRSHERRALLADEVRSKAIAELASWRGPIQAALPGLI